MSYQLWLRPFAGFLRLLSAPKFFLSILVVAFTIPVEASESEDTEALGTLRQGEVERQSFHPDQGLRLASKVLTDRAGASREDTVWLDAAVLAGSCLQDLGLIHQADTLSAEAVDRVAGQSRVSPRRRAWVYLSRASVDIDLGDIQAADSLLALAESLRPGPSEFDSALAIAVYAARVVLTLQTGHVDEAESLCTQLEGLTASDSGRPTAETYTISQMRARILYSQGRYADADSAVRQLVSLAAATYGSGHFQYAVVLTQQAFVAKSLGRYDESERLHRESLALRETTLPETNLNRINGLDNLSNILWVRGKYEEADRLANRVLDLTERLFGRETLRYSEALESVGYGVFTRGEYYRADTLFQTVLDIQRNVLGESCLPVANTMINLAVINRVLARLQEAEQWLESSLEIRVSLLGDSHALVAQTMNTLAQVRLDQKKTEGVEDLLQRVLEIRAVTIGTESQEYGQTLNLLADMHELEGQAALATPLLIKALDIRRKTFGNYHSNTWQNLRRLANNYVVRELTDSALVVFEQFFARQREYMSHVLSDASESVKLQWAYESEPHDDSFLSFMLQSPRPDVLEAGYREILSNKAAVLEALMLERDAAVCSADPRVTVLYEGLKSIRSRVSSVILGRADASVMEVSRDSLKYWIESEDSLGAELSSLCADYGRLESRLTVEPASVCSSLAEGQVILDYVRYVPNTFDSLGANSYYRHGHHYLLFVVSRSGVMAAKDLGPVEPVDSLAREIVGHMGEVGDRLYLPLTAQYETELKELARDLYKLVIGPVEPYAAQARHLIVSPEGPLCLVPFQVLCDSNNAYLVENFDISYVVSAREIPQWQPRSSQPGEAWIVADPDFDRRSSPSKTDIYAGTPAAPSRASTVGTSHSSSPADCLPDKFQRMAHAADEARSIEADLSGAARYRKVTIFSGIDASELLFDTLTSSPELLHVITHGYFCGGEDRPALGASVSAYSPLLRSGLVLAGANLGDFDSAAVARENDGILTALEISGLQLGGTDLVILSACATGVGHEFGSEGILGLNRSFLHAGARSVVMSLWEIPDFETSKLMTRFYQSYAQGQGTAESLREASLALMEEMRQTYGHAHPCAWGAFILYGRWY